jgi:transposase
MRALIAGRDWLMVIRLPAYAADLNPADGVWAWRRHGVADIAVHGVDHLARLVKQRLQACRRQSDLMPACSPGPA